MKNIETLLIPKFPYTPATVSLTNYVSPSNGWQDICNRPDTPYTVSRPYLLSATSVLSASKEWILIRLRIFPFHTEEKKFLQEEFQKVAEALGEKTIYFPTVF